jgi:hypothetical protein
MKDDDWVRSHLIQVDLPNGVFIVNEGNFWSGNSTLSFYDPLKKEVINNLFSDVNGYPLGDVGQSMGIYGNRGYIVANNSGKIWVIDVTTARYTEIISGLTSPRYVHFVNSKKAYITDLYAGEITIFNPGNNQKTGSILTKGHPSTEQMVQIGDLVFVTCWSYDNTILVIDSKKDSVTGEIKTAKQPGSIVVDKANKLWVLCDGGLGKTGKGIPVLQRINPESGNIELSLELTSDVNAKRLAINGTQDTLFFINKGIWKMPYTAQTLPDAPFIRSSQLLYGLGVDRRNSEVYFSNAIDYQQKGVVYRYSALGAKIDSFKTGITPGAFCFK